MTTPTTPTTLVARSPQDVLAVVPVVLGFVPQDSVVMLTFGATSAFHARIDLPPPPDVPEAVSLLLDPALRHRVRRVVFVLYTDDAGLAAHVSGALVAGLRGRRRRRRGGAARRRPPLVPPAPGARRGGGAWACRTTCPRTRSRRRRWWTGG